MTTTRRPRTEVLGRYMTPAGARTLYARRKEGVTYISDEPGSRHTPGVLYVVEQIPDHDGAGAVDALAGDYLQQARAAGAIPMELTLFTVKARAAA